MTTWESAQTKKRMVFFKENCNISRGIKIYFVFIS